MRIAIADVNVNRLDEAVAGIPGSLGVVADVADPATVDRLASSVVDTNLVQSRRDNEDPRSGVPGVSPRIIAPEEVADAAISAMRAGRFYVVTHPEWLGRVQARVEPILDAFNE
jgi:hypothetical protein